MALVTLKTLADPKLTADSFPRFSSVRISDFPRGKKKILRTYHLIPPKFRLILPKFQIISPKNFPVSPWKIKNLHRGNSKFLGGEWYRLPVVS